MKVRRLTPLDAEPFRALRLKALSEELTAFASSYEEETGYLLATYEGWLAVEPDRSCFGVFEDDALVGFVALARERKAKLKHKATIMGLYVLPESRRKGAARALLNEALSLANSVPGLNQINIGVVSANTPAKRLYETLGFRPYGVEPSAMFISDKAYDEVLMWLPLPRENLPTAKL